MVKNKIIFVVQFCHPYYQKIFELLSQRYDIDFFFFGGDMSLRKVDKSIRETWGKIGDFKGRYLKGFYLLPNLRITPSLIFRLLLGRYSIFIKCHNGRFSLPVTFLIAKLLKRPFILWTEIWWHPETLFHRFSYFFIKMIYLYADAICANGEHVRNYLISLGINSNKIFVSPPAVDNALYNKEVSEQEIKEIKDKLGIKNEKVILYVGRLVYEKGLIYLLEAYRNLNISDVALVLIGEGPFKKYLERITEKEKLRKVFFLNHIPNKLLYKYYALADIFVIPSIKTKYSIEGWGMVINEAMNQSLPIVATDCVGAVQGGLIRNGLNGFVVPSRDSKALQKAIERLLIDDNLRNKMREASYNIIKEWTYERMLKGFVRAIEYVRTKYGI